VRVFKRYVYKTLKKKKKKKTKNRNSFWVNKQNIQISETIQN